MLSVLLSIGGFLIFSGSSAFSGDIIFFNEQDKNGDNFVIEDNIEIVIEWSLSFCIFIACITLSLLIIRSTKNQHFTHDKMKAFRKNKERANTINALKGFDIMLETEPQWADV